MKHVAFLVGLVGAALLLALPCPAATRSWLCNWANNNWSTATNWVPNGVPQNGDTLVFSASSPRRDCINDLADLRLDALQIIAGNYEIKGNGLTLSNGLFVATAPLTWFYPNLTLGKTQAFDVDGASTLRLYSDINLNGFSLTLDTDSYFETHGAFSGNGNLTKLGAGDLLMAGSPNTFNGSFTHFSGLFSVAKASCLPTNFSSYGATKIYNSDATHTNSSLTLYPGASMTANNSVTNTIRNLTLHGATMEDTKLHFVLRGNLTNLAWNTESRFYGHLDLQNTNHFFHINDGAADKDLVIANGGIRGGTSAGFIKTGAGKLHFYSLGNSAGGTNQIVAGIVEGGMMANPLGTGRTVVQDGASVQALTGSTLSAYFELHGNGVGGTNGAIRGLGNPEMYGPFLIPTAATIRGDGELHLNGNIGGFGSLTIAGTNQVWTQGAANTLLGGYWVRSGTFILNKGDGTLAVGTPIVVGSDGFFDVEPAELRNFGNEQIATQVTVAQSGRYNLNGKTETLPKLTLRSASQAFMNGGTLILSGDLEVVPSLFTVAPAIFDGGGFLSVGTGSRNLIVNEALALELRSTELTGSANIFKRGDGDLRIKYFTGYSGNMNIEAGNLEVTLMEGFGSGAGGTFVNGPGALVLSGSAFSDTEALTFNATGRVDSASWVLKTNSSWRGPINVQHPARVSVAANSTLTLRSPISGVGGLVKEGPGEILVDWNRTNTFTGGLVIKDGRVTLNRDHTNLTITSAITIGDGAGALAGAQLWVKDRQQIANTVDVTMLGDGLFVVTNVNEAEIIRTLNGGGQLRTYGNGLRLNDGGFDSTFVGSINGNGTFTKAGAGKFTHTGLCVANGLLLSMFGGETTINGTWNGSPNPTLIDAWSGTVLSGTGAVQNVNLRSGATLSPGAGPGTFTLNNLTMTIGANLFLELRGPTPGTQHDQVIAKSSVALSNATLTLALQYPPVEGDVLRLVDNQGAGAIQGIFNGRPQGSLISLSGNQFLLSYTGGTGNDITLTATNTRLALAATLLPGGNGRVDPGECNELFLVLTNKSGGSLSGVTAMLDSRTPGVAVAQQNSAYPNFSVNAARTNSSAFRLTTLPGFVCGAWVDLQLTVTVAGVGTFAIPVQLPSGTLGTPFAYSPRPPFSVPIPDQGTTNATFNITNFPGRVGKVSVSFQINHTFAADLWIYLQSPSGTLVKLVGDRGGSGDNFGTNCAPESARTTFDDSAPTSILTASAPFVGTFRPEEPLANFIGEPADGPWKLILSDDAPQDTGTLNCWTLTLTPATCAPDAQSPCTPCVAQTTGLLTAQSPFLPQRLKREAAPSVCAEAKPCPGLNNGVGAFRYGAHTFTNTGPGGCITVVLQDPCGDGRLMAVAYLGGFNPADLCAGYLGDTGDSGPAPSMSFYAAQNAVYTVVVVQVLSGLSCSSYSLTTFGLPCPPPQLNIAPATGNQVRLSWNAIGSEGFTLQTAPTASGALFTNVPTAPTLLNGTLSLTNPATGPQRYFRLTKP